jgi:presenilin-like A22 family membrane protease
MAKAKPAKNEKYLGFALFASLVTLAILPNAMDAFLIPKAIILVLGAIWYFLSVFKIPRNLSKDPVELILISFSIWLFILLIKSDYKWVTLFGVQGRS